MRRPVHSHQIVPSESTTRRWCASHERAGFQIIEHEHYHSNLHCLFELPLAQFPSLNRNSRVFSLLCEKCLSVEWNSSLTNVCTSQISCVDHSDCTSNLTKELLHFFSPRLAQPYEYSNTPSHPPSPLPLGGEESTHVRLCRTLNSNVIACT